MISSPGGGELRNLPAAGRSKAGCRNGLGVYSLGPLLRCLPLVCSIAPGRPHLENKAKDKGREETGEKCLQAHFFTSDLSKSVSVFSFPVLLFCYFSCVSCGGPWSPRSEHKRPRRETGETEVGEPCPHENRFLQTDLSKSVSVFSFPVLLFCCFSCVS